MHKNINLQADILQIHDLKFHKFITEETILSALDHLGEILAAEYNKKEPVLLVVLNGAFVFAAELLKRLDFPLQVEFIRYQSYEGLVSRKEVKRILPIPPLVRDRNILILEDIVDTGFTLSTLREDLKALHPKSIKTASLFFKPHALMYSEPPEFTAIEVGNEFLVGYGLDYKGFGRNLRSVYRLPPL